MVSVPAVITLISGLSVWWNSQKCTSNTDGGTHLTFLCRCEILRICTTRPGFGSNSNQATSLNGSLSMSLRYSNKEIVHVMEETIFPTALNNVVHVSIVHSDVASKVVRDSTFQCPSVIHPTRQQHPYLLSFPCCFHSPQRQVLGSPRAVHQQPPTGP